MEKLEQKPSSNNTFRPGLRLSWIDVIVLAIGFGAGIWGAMTKFIPAMIGAYVICIFFLFCNVFRIRRSLELIWAGIFLILGSAQLHYSNLSWPIVFSIGLLVALILVAIEMRHPGYHGIFWQKINPALPEWWRQQRTNTA